MKKTNTKLKRNCFKNYVKIQISVPLLKYFPIRIKKISRKFNSKFRDYKRVLMRVTHSSKRNT